MTEQKFVVGFIGAGGIARSHAYSLNSLRYFYSDPPEIVLKAVCSARPESRSAFAEKFGFARAIDIKSFASDNEINTVFILGPNKVHCEHLKLAFEMPAVTKIYLEKPVCSSPQEEHEIASLLCKRPEIRVQVGFQFLFSSAVREMLKVWKTGDHGSPVHFDLKYYHSDYLHPEYRRKRVTRLTPAPDGGAMADLGSHSISLLIAFLGNQLRITGALQGGHFHDVPEGSDLFSLINLYDESSGAVGTISASRISAGTGDHFTTELYSEAAALRYSSREPDSYEYFTNESALWTIRRTGSNFGPVTAFPSPYVPSGWLRSLLHAHYVFLTGRDMNEFVPDIEHGLAVQRLVSDTSIHLRNFRDLVQYR